MNQLSESGFEIIENIYTAIEVEAMLQLLKEYQVAQQFGIRAFLKKYPGLLPLIFNDRLKTIINDFLPKGQLIKSIYFDKPPNANWIVNWHQDLTINVIGQTSDPEYKNWRMLKDRTVVQAPLTILQNIVTIRIHLDDCTEENGALRVVPKSHLEGIVKIGNQIASLKAAAQICEIQAGGILLMKPLTFHASKRTNNNLSRRVIHLEFCNIDLPKGMEWQERVY